MQSAKCWWGHNLTAEEIGAKPYQFWPTKWWRQAIGFPEDVLVIGAQSRAEVWTQGLYSCHAVAIGALSMDGEAALYLVHNYADEVSSTKARVRKAIQFMIATNYEPVFAAALGPADSALELSRFNVDYSFESKVFPEIQFYMADNGLTPELITYRHATLTNGLGLTYRPGADVPFVSAIT